MTYEILYNSKVGYTLNKSLDGVNSYKRVPLKFKFTDSTAKYRQEILYKKLF